MERSCCHVHPPNPRPSDASPLGRLEKARPHHRLCFSTGGKNESARCKLPALLTIPKSPVAPPAPVRFPHWPRVLQKLGTYCAKPSRPRVQAGAATPAAPSIRQATSCLLGVARPLSSHTALAGACLEFYPASSSCSVRVCWQVQRPPVFAGFGGGRCKAGTHTRGRGGTASLLASPLLPRRPLGPTLLHPAPPGGGCAHRLQREHLRTLPRTKRRPRPLRGSLRRSKPPRAGEMLPGAPSIPGTCSAACATLNGTRGRLRRSDAVSLSSGELETVIRSGRGPAALQPRSSDLGPHTPCPTGSLSRTHVHSPRFPCHWGSGPRPTKPRPSDSAWPRSKPLPGPPPVRARHTLFPLLPARSPERGDRRASPQCSGRP